MGCLLSSSLPTEKPKKSKSNSVVPSDVVENTVPTKLIVKQVEQVNLTNAAEKLHKVDCNTQPLKSQLEAAKSSNLAAQVSTFSANSNSTKISDATNIEENSTVAKKDLRGTCSI